MAFQKGNTLGKKFTSDNQPRNRGRKPQLYKQIKEITGKKVENGLEKDDFLKIMQWIVEQDTETVQGLIKGADGRTNKNTPLWMINMISAINADIRYGRTTTLEMILDRLFGKSTQPLDANVDAQVTSTVDFSALSTEELLQYNALNEKMKHGKK